MRYCPACSVQEMINTRENPKIIDICATEGLLEKWRECNVLTCMLMTSGWWSWIDWVPFWCHLLTWRRRVILSFFRTLCVLCIFVQRETCGRSLWTWCRRAWRTTLKQKGWALGCGMYWFYRYMDPLGYPRLMVFLDGELLIHTFAWQLHCVALKGTHTHTKSTYFNHIRYIQIIQIHI